MKKCYEKGITLIALIITIIVLLIIAGVSISLLSGDNGILNKAKLAKQNSDSAQESENTKLGSYENTMNEIVNGTTNNTIDNKVYLYNYGDEEQQITGGYTLRYNSVGTSFTKYSDSLYVFANRSGPNAGITVSTCNPINTTGYSKIVIEYQLDYYAVDWSYEPAVMFFGLLQDAINPVYDIYGYITTPNFTKYISKGASTGSTNIQECTLDISNVNKQIYFALFATDSQYPTSRISIHIYQIYMQ